MNKNWKNSHSNFMQVAAWLARDLDYDPDQPPTELQVENWRRETMKMIQTTRVLFAENIKLRDRIKELETDNL